MVSFNFDAGQYIVGNWKVADEPRYPHRGLLIDSSRHFLPLDTIYRVIDSMAYAKVGASDTRARQFLISYAGY